MWEGAEEDPGGGCSNSRGPEGRDGEKGSDVCTARERASALALACYIEREMHSERERARESESESERASRAEREFIQDDTLSGRVQGFTGLEGRHALLHALNVGDT